MRLLALLLLFLSSCGIVHIEVRDRKPQKVIRKQPEERTAPQASTRQDRETRQEPREQPRQRRQEETHKPTEPLRVQAPVRGRVSRTDRGYYIATSCDDFFRSVSDGRVLYAGDDIRGMGWVVMVDSEDGYVYVYARAESSLVKRGEAVRRGQPLGKVGRSGDTCGLLFEVRDVEGRPVSFELML